MYQNKNCRQMKLISAEILNLLIPTKEKQSFQISVTYESQKINAKFF